MAATVIVDESKVAALGFSIKITTKNMPSLASIFVLLQAVVALYSNPQVSTNPVLKAQVDLMASQVTALATQALTQSPETQLGIAPTSSEPFSIIVPTSTDQSSTQPIVINVTPIIQQVPVVSQPVLGVSPATSTPVQIHWIDNRCDGGNIIGMTTGVGYGFNGVDIPVGITQTSTIFNFGACKRTWDSATITINSQTYNPPILQGNSVEFGIQGLQSGKTYPYTIKINSGNEYAVDSDTVEIP